METSCVCLYFTKSDLDLGPKFIQWRPPPVSAFTKSRFSRWIMWKKWLGHKARKRGSPGTRTAGEVRKEGRSRKYYLRLRIKFRPEVVLNPILLPSLLKIYDGIYIQFPQTVLDPCFLILLQLPPDGNHQECNASNNGAQDHHNDNIGTSCQMFHGRVRMDFLFR